MSGLQRAIAALGPRPPPATVARLLADVAADAFSAPAAEPSNARELLAAASPRWREAVDLLRASQRLVQPELPRAHEALATTLVERVRCPPGGWAAGLALFAAAAAATESAPGGGAEALTDAFARLSPPAAVHVLRNALVSRGGGGVAPAFCAPVWELALRFYTAHAAAQPEPPRASPFARTHVASPQRSMRQMAMTALLDGGEWARALAVLRHVLVQRDVLSHVATGYLLRVLGEHRRWSEAAAVFALVLRTVGAGREIAARGGGEAAAQAASWARRERRFNAALCIGVAAMADGCGRGELAERMARAAAAELPHFRLDGAALDALRRARRWHRTGVEGEAEGAVAPVDEARLLDAQTSRGEWLAACATYADAIKRQSLTAAERSVLEQKRRFVILATPDAAAALAVRTAFAAIDAKRNDASPPSAQQVAREVGAVMSRLHSDWAAALRLLVAAFPAALEPGPLAPGEARPTPPTLSLLFRAPLPWSVALRLLPPLKRFVPTPPPPAAPPTALPPPLLARDDAAAQRPPPWLLMLSAAAVRCQLAGRTAEAAQLCVALAERYGASPPALCIARLPPADLRRVLPAMRHVGAVVAALADTANTETWHAALQLGAQIFAYRTRASLPREGGSEEGCAALLTERVPLVWIVTMMRRLRAEAPPAARWTCALRVVSAVTAAAGSDECGDATAAEAMFRVVFDAAVCCLDGSDRPEVAISLMRLAARRRLAVPPHLMLPGMLDSVLPHVAGPGGVQLLAPLVVGAASASGNFGGAPPRVVAAMRAANLLVALFARGRSDHIVAATSAVTLCVRIAEYGDAIASVADTTAPDAPPPTTEQLLGGPAEPQPWATALQLLAAQVQRRGGAGLTPQLVTFAIRLCGTAGQWRAALRVVQAAPPAVLSSRHAELFIDRFGWEVALQFWLPRFPAVCAPPRIAEATIGRVLDERGG